MTERGYSARIDGNDSDALGLTAPRNQDNPGRADGSPGSLRDSVWQELRSCFDPEIPVNIVDLGLIYGCDVQALTSGGHKAIVRFTLTAQGCGMGQFLKRDIERKLQNVPGIEEIDVELVWDPPWNQSMISASAKQQLGIE
jgi:probable FeS assembly SUF system protein SufT